MAESPHFPQRDAEKLFFMVSEETAT
jgi:hypothetical protein